MTKFYANKFYVYCGSKRSDNSNAGFTLPELLAAMLFLALVIPVALQGVVLANRAAVVAERKMTATRLAEKVLQEMVITGTWQTGAKQGEFGEEWPGYRWVLHDEAWQEDTMQLLIVFVYYNVQGQEHHIRLCTLVDNSEDETVEENA